MRMGYAVLIVPKRPLVVEIVKSHSRGHENPSLTHFHNILSFE